MRTRDKTITIRCTDEEKKRIITKSEQSTLPLQEYILRCALGKKITVIEGFDSVLKAQKAVGNNLNQIAMLANLGRINVINLEKVKQKFATISKLLSDISSEVK